MRNGVVELLRPRRLGWGGGGHRLAAAKVAVPPVWPFTGLAAKIDAASATK